MGRGWGCYAEDLAVLYGSGGAGARAGVVVGLRMRIGAWIEVKVEVITEKQRDRILEDVQSSEIARAEIQLSRSLHVLISPPPIHTIIYQSPHDLQISLPLSCQLDLLYEILTHPTSPPPSPSSASTPPFDTPLQPPRLFIIEQVCLAIW